MTLRIGLAQLDPALGLFPRNLESHLASVDAARDQAVDLLLFPELSLTGYLLKDLVPEIARPWPHPAFEPLLTASRNLDLAFGFVERGEDGLNYLCEGYKHFFGHIDPKMRRMADLLRAGREAPEIMEQS